MDSIQEVIDIWRDRPQTHKLIHETFIQKVNEDAELNAHRTWVEENKFGFGERSFHWLHKLIINEFPDWINFCEIGIFKAQVLSLYKLIGLKTGKRITRYGISPLDTTGGVWDSDYENDIKVIHNKFNLPCNYTIYKGLSTDLNIIEQAKTTAPYDVLFIDGGHDYETALSDLVNYTPLVAPKGFLIVDDACNDMQMPWGYFQGILSVTKAVKEWEKTQTDFEFLFNVVHNRVYRRKAV